MGADLVVFRAMARISSLLACWIGVAALAEPSAKAAKDNAAYVIHVEHPAYPFELRQFHIDGTGLFLLHVRPDGSVPSVDTVQSKGIPIWTSQRRQRFSGGVFAWAAR